MRVIALANQKGGCGKTTVGANLAIALARLDHRVLLVDNDPQGHATLALGFRERDFTRGSYDLYLGTDVRVEDVVLAVEANLHLVPTGVELSAVEPELAGAAARDERLRRGFRGSEMPYDFVLIDCPPSVSLLTFNALVAAGEAIVPVDPSYQSLQALRKFKETLALLRERKRHDVVPRILLANFDTRPRFACALIAEIEASYDGELLETIIHPSVRFREAFARGVSVVDHDPTSRGARDIRNLANELAAQTIALSAAETARWLPLLRGPRVAASEVVFVVDFPRAERVSVTGSFCDWAPEGLPLTLRDDGLWERRLPLSPGTYQYRYVVDDAWVPDPHNDVTVPNDFGEVNSCVTVPE